MLTQEEEKFVAWWQVNRDKQKKNFRMLLIGMPVGVLMGIGIILSLVTGWHKKATVVANSAPTFNPVVLLIGVGAIIVFVSIFYKQHAQEMNEQRYQELLHKKKKQSTDGNAA